MVIKTGDAVRADVLPGFTTSAAAPLRLLDGVGDATTLLCQRPTLTLNEGDFRVPLDLGLPLYVHASERILAVEQVGGFRVRVVQGKLSPEENAAVVATVDRAQALAQTKAE